MAKSGSEVATNFVPILYISQLYPNFVYSQLITAVVIFSFCYRISVKIASSLYHKILYSTSLIQTHIYGISISLNVIGK